MLYDSSQSRLYTDHGGERRGPASRLPRRGGGRAEGDGHVGAAGAADGAVPARGLQPVRGAAARDPADDDRHARQDGAQADALRARALRLRPRQGTDVFKATFENMVFGTSIPFLKHPNQLARDYFL